MQKSILADLNSWPKPGSAVLDFGCGNGELVKVYGERGYHAFGCELEFKEGENTESLQAQGSLRLIAKDPYRLPFDDESFDLVVSDQVFEHVRDYEVALAEISRVTRNGGVSLHTFPSRYRMLEPHVFVPLGTMIRSHWWLSLWAGAGIRNDFQKGMSAGDTAKANRDWLVSSTNYLSKREIHDRFAGMFREMRFSEDLFLKQSKRGRMMFSMSRYLPWLPALYSAFGSRVVFTRKG